MELLYLILLILAIAYIPIYLWVWRSPKAKSLGLAKYGPTVMIKTKWGTKIMERMARYRRFWRFFGLFSIAVSLFLMAFIVFIIVVGITNLPASFASKGLGVEYALAIPGLNPLIPVLYGWIGLVVAMVVHELAHGFQTRANDMRVDSTGVLYAVVPLGAFVEPNEEDIKKSTRRAKLDLYSAGVSMNVITAAVTFFIFAVLMLGGISSAYGDSAAVYQITSNSPAHHAGIPSGAILLTVDGHEYVYGTDTFSWAPGEKVTMTFLTQDGESDPVEIRWGLFIESVVSDSPAGKNNNLKEKTFILSINGVDIHDYPGFMSFLQTTRPGDTANLVCMTPDAFASSPKTFEIKDKRPKTLSGPFDETFTDGPELLPTFTVSLFAEETIPNASINFVTEKLTGLVPGATYSINNTTVNADSSGNVPIDKSWMGVRSTIIKKGVPADGTSDSEPQILHIPARPGAPENISWTNVTGMTDNGTITNVNEMMEYKLSTATTWTSITGNTVTDLAPGEYSVRWKATADGEEYNRELTLGNNKGVGYVGITSSTSGMVFTTPNIMLEKARNPIYGAEKVPDVATKALAYITGPFNGFSPMPQSVHWWYDVPMENVFWILISVFYWIFWLSIMLGVTNAIPAIPFDGGFIFQGSLSSLMQRLGMKNEEKREALTTRITSSLSLVMIFLLILTIVAVVL